MLDKNAARDTRIEAFEFFFRVYRQPNLASHRARGPFPAAHGLGTALQDVVEALLARSVLDPSD